MVVIHDATSPPKITSEDLVKTHILGSVGLSGN